MKTALITGITGQDGSYMAELLLKKGYRVIGAVRTEPTDPAIYPASLMKQVEPVSWDMRSPQKMMDLLSEYRPDEMYNFAAFSSGAGMFDQPIEIGDLNGLAVTRILEAIQNVSGAIRFCQASSREMFDAAAGGLLSEKTPLAPQSPYGAAKAYAHAMVQIYRQRYGLFACSAILFNHESPRRGSAFVSRKITEGVAQIKWGRLRKIELGNLEGRRDWGWAPEYVEAMWRMLQHHEPDDYVIATGITHTVREFVTLAFQSVGIEIIFEGEGENERGINRETGEVIVEVSPRLFRSEGRREGKDAQIGDYTKTQQTLGWAPRTSFENIVRIMVEADCERVRAGILKQIS